MTVQKLKTVKAVAYANIEGVNIRELQQFIENIRLYSLSVYSRYTGPVSFKTKVLKLNTRRSSSGEGSGTQFYYMKKIWRKRITIYDEKVFYYILKTKQYADLLCEVELL